MDLRRSSSNHSQGSCSKKTHPHKKTTARPGFMSMPTNSDKRCSSDESIRSTSALFQNSVNPVSSHLITSPLEADSSSENFSATTNSRRGSPSVLPRYDSNQDASRRSQATVQEPKMKKPAANVWLQEKTAKEPRISDNAIYQINILKEKYSKLKEDYNNKLEEVSSARVELEGALKDALVRHKSCEKSEQKANDLMAKLREAENNKSQRINSRDKLLEMENQLAHIRSKHRESLDDIAEAKRVLREQQDAVENTRRLYLETEQLAEVQKKKIENLSQENQSLLVQKTSGVEYAKEQFQLQVQELRPLEDTVSRMNDRIMLNREKKRVADKRAETLNLEIGQLTNRNREIKSKVAAVKKKIGEIEADKLRLREQLDAQDGAKDEATDENYLLRAKIRDLEELNSDKEEKIHQKVNEVEDLSARLETLREECARQVSANKMSLASSRKSNLKRLSALEKDLARTKASENGAEEERDEIRNRLEQQIHSLGQNLVQARDKIKLLQESVGHMNKDRNMRHPSPFIK
ncbi:outer dense fiber of sperm tails 2 [Nesidiocoris tenuis]|uniref:Outer dense fiber of sperm tails 2 n=1 Tax=Nesidiocoris tenuis TaxID=355587 RepID=A0ABN7B2U8_9HEMI|nr:outer dense fiber of sperm tails 2 [Nesidiocoris tenuis]